MDFYIFNQTLGVLCHDQKYRMNITKGTSSFCSMDFGNARIAHMCIKEANRVHIDIVITSEYLETLMAQQLMESFEKAMKEAEKNKKA